MALPPDVQAAKDRMDNAEAAARADVESGQYDSKRRNALLAKLEQAMHEYLDMMAHSQEK
jgi:hypothetical protein